MRCLLVDDEPGIREGLAMLLRRRGFEVATAEDCAAARARLDEQAFDVVVPDWRLPDGAAITFLRDCDVPAIAVSGHPDEVERVAAIRAVLAKPITPDKLLACIQQHVSAEAERDEPSVELLPDVRAIVDDVVAQLPAGSEIECRDDGTFVVLRARIPAGSVPTVRHLGGDLRVVETAEGRLVELRACRDGRPDADVPVARIDGAWPTSGCFALDCAGVDVDEATFVGWLDRAGELRRGGAELSLINVPGSLSSATAVWEATHDMPMRERVGPRLPAELAELWS